MHSVGATTHGDPIAPVILGVIDDAIFSGVVLMVIVTTLIEPPWLGRAVSAQIARERAAGTSSSTR